jgi:ketosteroid isomerase-like protein
MKTRTIVALLSCIALALCLSVTPSASAASAEEEVLQVTKDLIKAIDNWDLDLQSSLYWRSEEMSYFGPKKDSAFLTRGWEENFKGNESMKAFPKGSITWAFHNQEVTMLDDNAAIITTYAIVNVNPPLVEQTITDHVRLTLVVKKIGGKWLIVHQHESFFPSE